LANLSAALVSEVRAMKVNLGQMEVSDNFSMAYHEIYVDKIKHAVGTLETNETTLTSFNLTKPNNQEPKHNKRCNRWNIICCGATSLLGENT